MNKLANKFVDTYTRTQFGAKVSVRLVQNVLRVETLHQPKALELADQIERMGIPAASMIISDILHTLVEEAHAVGDDDCDLCEFDSRKRSRQP